MGYTTDFEGTFTLNKKLTKTLQTTLTKLATTRRMKRKMDAKYGIDGEFYLDGEGMFGQEKDSTVVDYNAPPSTQPGLWCQWVPTADGKGIEWDGNEKFYNYVEWLEYIISTYLKPKGYKLNGTVKYFGEDRDDIGQIQVTDNVVNQLQGTITYKESK